MTSAAASQMDLFAEAPTPAPTPAPTTPTATPLAWTREERESVRLALVGSYQEIAVAKGLHSMPGARQGHIAHAEASEIIASNVHAAIVHSLDGIAGSAERAAERDEQHAAWLETDAGRLAYGPNAGDNAPRFRELAAEQRKRLAWYLALIEKVVRAPERDLPVDLAELAARAKQARANAELDLTDPELSAVTHWPEGWTRGMNGPMCDALDCKRCRPG